MTYPDSKQEAARLLAMVKATMPAPVRPLDGDDLILLPAVHVEVNRLFDYIVEALTPAMSLLAQNQWVVSLRRSVAPADLSPHLHLESHPWKFTFSLYIDPCFASSPAWMHFEVWEYDRQREAWRMVDQQEIGCLAELPDRWEWRFVDSGHRGKSTAGGVPLDQLRPLLPDLLGPYLDTAVRGCVEASLIAASEIRELRQSR